MSKSIGNTVAPQKISDTLGADILRLWVAATDYSGELSISDEILKRVTESYRRIRNTLRFLLANTSDFDATKDAVAVEELSEIDRYAIARMGELQTEILAHYEIFEYHPVVAKLQMFCSEDLGGFYLDILKDRLYTCGTTSKARRSAQTAIWHITQALLRLMAPILSFTVEEAWAVFASKEEYAASGETIFTQSYYQLPQAPDSAALATKWALVRRVRAEAMRKLEDVRVNGQIGSSLQGEVDVYADGVIHDALASLGDDLKFVFIVSRCDLHPLSEAGGLDSITEKSGEGEVETSFAIAVTPSTHEKCERCWHYRADVNEDITHPGICGRCVSNQFGEGEPRKFA